METNAFGVTRPEIRGMNDSFGFLPRMQRAMERDAHDDDLAAVGDDYRDAQVFEVCS